MKAVHMTDQFTVQTFTESGYAFGTVPHLGTRKFRGYAKPRDGRDILMPGPASAFLDAAVQQRTDTDAVTKVQGSDARGTVHLLRGQSQRIDFEILYIDRYDTGCTHSVRVDRYILFVGKRTDVSKGLNGTDFVTGMHHGYEDSVIPKRPLHISSINETATIHRYLCYLKPLTFHRLRRV